jgi:hypothetical protein
MVPPARHGGRRRLVNVREVLNGIFYVLWTGNKPVLGARHAGYGVKPEHYTIRARR